MEIYETTLNSGILSIKARGRQRCKVIQGSVKQLGGRILQATVKVLPEPEVKSPVAGSMLMALKKTRHNFDNDFDTILKNYKTRRYHLSQYPVYSWLLDRHEPLYFVKQIIKGLGRFYSQGKLKNCFGTIFLLENLNIFLYYFLYLYIFFWIVFQNYFQEIRLLCPIGSSRIFSWHNKKDCTF